MHDRPRSDHYTAVVLVSKVLANNKRSTDLMPGVIDYRGCEGTKGDHEGREIARMRL